MQLCRGCGTLCQNGGTCQAGAVSYTCICPNGFTGQNCGTQTSCDPGTALSSSGGCHPCLPGTFSISGLACVACQKGTASNVTAATQSCPPCASGTYASTAATSCTSCASCQKVGSYAQDTGTLTAVAANQSSVPSPGQTTATAAPVSGWVFVGVLIAFMLISLAILFPLRLRTRRYVTAVSVILRTPFTFLRVVPTSWHVVEVPSFYRGLIGLWVIAGLVLITAYQSEVFVADGVTTQSYVQPGSQFTSRNSTSSATADISLTIVLFQTPITCDPTLFKFLVAADATTSAGSLTGPPDCVEDSSLSSVNLTFKFPAPLSFSPTSTVSVQAASVSSSGSPPVLPWCVFQDPAGKL